MDETSTYVPSGALPLTTINWRAIFGGVVVALAVQILLTTLGLAIGATTVGASTDASTARDAGIGVGIWYLVSNLISVFCGGLVAGISARETTRTLGAIEGMVVWALSLLLFLWFVTGGVQSLIAQASGMIMPEPDVRGMQMPQGLEDMGPDLSRRDAQQVATASTIAAWIAFGTLLLAAVSGTIGGIVGARFNRRRLVVPSIGYRREVVPPVAIHPREA
ncbi:hypothetical protein DB32_000886 [Sandaracinus amylolyticus]|uniref:Transmembrane protein n=1 Tax=Sandaracinus amylolyticus TaxID=927083 RepID=A0A0F6VZN6_9BACT|nr:hypothetical protein DB32_000886 [Sandaracinus amylolyticus]